MTGTADHKTSEFRKLLEEVKNGSATAVERLVTEYGPVIRHVIRGRLDPRIRSKFDSIDFEQMVWASVFRVQDPAFDFETPQDFCRFLAALARNKVIDEHRRRFNSQKRQVTREQDWDSETAASQNSREPSPSQVAQARELASRMLRGHSARNRRIMEMRMEGASVREIADALQIDMSTVRRTIARVTQTRLRFRG